MGGPEGAAMGAGIGRDIGIEIRAVNERSIVKFSC